MVPLPGQASADGGHLIQSLLAEFLKGFSLRTLIFLLDMVLPQLDAYHTGRRLHLQPWVSVELSQQHARGQQGTQFEIRDRYEAYAHFHVIQLVTDGAPILLFSDPTTISRARAWDLGEAGALGSLESNVMAGRDFLGHCSCLMGSEGVLSFSCKKKSCKVRVRQRRIEPVMGHEYLPQGL